MFWVSKLWKSCWKCLWKKLSTGWLWKDAGLSTGFITGFQQEGRAVFGRRGRSFWKFYTVSTGPTTTATTPLILILLLEREILAGKKLFSAG